MIRGSKLLTSFVLALLLPALISSLDDEAEAAACKYLTIWSHCAQLLFQRSLPYVHENVFPFQLSVTMKKASVLAKLTDFGMSRCK